MTDYVKATGYGGGTHIATRDAREALCGARLFMVTGSYTTPTTVPASCHRCGNVVARWFRNASAA